MIILLTGGAGYIGSFMTKELLARGYNVVVLDSLERGHEEVVDKRADFVKADLMDDDFVKKIFQTYRFDAVMHFAGYISMAESMINPGVYFFKNTFGSLNLLKNVVRHKVNTFIFSSTAGVYGNPIKIPIPEDHPLSPTNPYGESKLMVEKILHWFRKVYGLNFASLRYFNAAGAALDGSMGESHVPETHIIPLAIKAALEGSEFVLYGTDYATEDGTCIRDYIHVLDLVDAHILALEKLQAEQGGLFYNVGVGKGYSNKEVIDEVKKISGTDFVVTPQKRRPGDAAVLVADPTRIKEELGFSPKYSDLETIVRTAWEWHKKNPVFSSQG